MTIISSKDYQPQRVVDLRGPGGNAFVVMSLVQDILKQLGHDKEYIKEVLKDMQSDDYDHLIEVADQEIGQFYTFVR